MVLLWLLPHSPPAINTGGAAQPPDRLHALGHTQLHTHKHKLTQAHGHMEDINIITNSKQGVNGEVTQPLVIQSEQPLIHSPKVIGLGGQVGTATLLARDDNWLINVQLMATAFESTELQSETGLMKVLSHPNNSNDPQRRTQVVCVCVCIQSDRSSQKHISGPHIHF